MTKTVPDIATLPMLLHVGLHKCASTWLQTHFFDNAEIGVHSPWGGMAHHAVTEFVTVDPLRFSAEEARARLYGVARPAPPGAEICVMSHEALSSRPWQGSYYAPYVADRLKATFDNSRVLLVFREQKALIYSLYGEYVRTGGRLTLREFLGTRNDPPGFCGVCRLDFFHFDRLIQMYRDVFGAENVLALPLEMLARDSERFITEISGFMDVPTPQLPTEKRSNVATGALTNELFRLSNYLIRPDALKPQTGLTIRLRAKALRVFDRVMPEALQRRRDKRLRATVAGRAGDTFRDSNARLADMLSLDLATLGYDTASGPI